MSWDDDDLQIYYLWLEHHVNGKKEYRQYLGVELFCWWVKAMMIWKFSYVRLEHNVKREKEYCEYLQVATNLEPRSKCLNPYIIKKYEAA